MSEPSPARGPIDAAAEEYWRSAAIHDVMPGKEPWTHDADRAEPTDDEWDAFVRALAE